MRESEFVRDLRKNFLGVIHKNHVGGFGTVGLPDLEGCFRSRSVVIEAKVGKLGTGGKILLRNPLTPIQRNWLRKYHSEGALSLIAVYLEDLKRAAFFPFTSEFPSELNINQRFRAIGFLKPSYVEKKVIV